MCFKNFLNCKCKYFFLIYHKLHVCCAVRFCVIKKKKTSSSTEILDYKNNFSTQYAFVSKAAVSDLSTFTPEPRTFFFLSFKNNNNAGFILSVKTFFGLPCKYCLFFFHFHSTVIRIFFKVIRWTRRKMGAGWGVGVVVVMDVRFFFYGVQ